MKSLITLDPRLPRKSVFIGQRLESPTLLSPFLWKLMPFSSKIVSLQGPSPMQGLQSQERAVACHQNVYWLKQDQGHVVVIIANPSPYTLLTVSLLLALSTMYLITNPYKTVFFFPLWIYSMCGRSCLTPHLMSSWFLYLGEFRERFLLLPHLTFPSAMEISIFVLVFIKMGNLQGELYPLSIQWPWGLPSENMITQHWGLWPSHRGLEMMSWHTMLEMWSLMGICPGSTWASQAYHQHFWYIPSLLSQPSHPHR